MSKKRLQNQASHTMWHERRRMCVCCSSSSNPCRFQRTWQPSSSHVQKAELRARGCSVTHHESTREPVVSVPAAVLLLLLLLLLLHRCMPPKKPLESIALNGNACPNMPSLWHVPTEQPPWLGACSSLPCGPPSQPCGRPWTRRKPCLSHPPAKPGLP